MGTAGMHRRALKLVDEETLGEALTLAWQNTVRELAAKRLEAKEFIRAGSVIAQAMRGRTMSDIFPVLGLIVFGGAVLGRAVGPWGAASALDRLSRIEGKLDALEAFGHPL